MKIEYSISSDMLAANMLWSTITCALRDMLDDYGDNDDVLRLHYYDADHIEEAEEGVLLSNGGYYTDGFMFWDIGSIIVALVSFIVFIILWSD